MSFHASATSIELEDDYVLKAVLRDEDGDEQESTLDLNDILGNNDGNYDFNCYFTTAPNEILLLGGENFKDSAQDISLNREGDDEVPILRAVLNNVDGEGVEADINLAERITNENGNLVFQ
ncbi:hypothetical protein NUU61_001738 [Penicillium alfredii]|uniref:Cyanovirin-N domain-containing protein n=1 Tax=Penicillium alfredii TaxID=1506179 RepID=A0A9W9FQ52_9EURO|nr:uncharacterized protein NUU61_001738 [Penicillium alfredii]KAJ5104391.1 hypothetical protein NUU61_001738 [Penicillium alfredii]